MFAETFTWTWNLANKTTAATERTQWRLSTKTCSNTMNVAISNLHAIKKQHSNTFTRTIPCWQPITEINIIEISLLTNEKSQPITNSDSTTASAKFAFFLPKSIYFFLIFSPALGATPFPGPSPRQGRQNSTCSSMTLLFRKFGHFSASCPDLCSLVTFSKTHRRTQRRHSWIHLDLL